MVLMTGKNQENDEIGDAEKSEMPEPEKEAADLRDRLLRMAAEFDNYKKRVARDIDVSKESGRIDVISRLLPTVDEFELALDALDMEDEKLKGMSLIYSNMMSTLKGFGLREIDTDGKFDPYKHEIMLVQENDGEEGRILKVVRKGYMLNSFMLRPASVIVAKRVQQEDGKEKKG